MIQHFRSGHCRHPSVAKTIYGAEDQATLDEIAREWKKDRAGKFLLDGSIEAADDVEFVLGFQVSVRQTLTMPAEQINALGDPRRGMNVMGTSANYDEPPPLPRTLSHVVYFVPDWNDGPRISKVYFNNLLGK
jgi:hypothetical protein